MSGILELTNVCKNFGGVIAADNISFDIQKGQIHGLIGPNGAGKSTLMNLISGIYEMDSGKISFCGEDISKTPSYQRARLGISRTFQTPRFLYRSSVLDNMLLGTDLGDGINYMKSFMGKKKSNIIEKLERFMPVAGFNIDWEKDAAAIPYGQRKILEIIRSLLAEPKVMLVDEPAAGLNNREIENAMALLELAVKEYDISVLLIEHSMDMIMNSCSEIIVINFGQVICHGTPDVISNDPGVIEAYLGRDFNA